MLHDSSGGFCERVLCPPKSATTTSITIRKQERQEERQAPSVWTSQELEGFEEVVTVTCRTRGRKTWTQWGSHKLRHVPWQVTEFPRYSGKTAAESLMLSEVEILCRGYHRSWAEQGGLSDMGDGEGSRVIHFLGRHSEEIKKSSFWNLGDLSDKASMVWISADLRIPKFHDVFFGCEVQNIFEVMSASPMYPALNCPLDVLKNGMRRKPRKAQWPRSFTHVQTSCWQIPEICLRYDLRSHPRWRTEKRPMQLAGW